MSERGRGYEAWIAGRRALGAEVDLTDRVQRRIEAEPAARTTGRLVSTRLRIAISVIAVAVGVSRFVYLAVVARLIEL